MLVSNIGKFTTLDAIHKNFYAVAKKHSPSKNSKPFEADLNKDTNLIQNFILRNSADKSKLNTLA